MATNGPITFKQQSFEGGMNFTFEGTKIAENQYMLLVNGRNRFGSIDPIKLPALEMDGLPAGVIIQGVYGMDKYLLVFASGKAYYKDMGAVSPVFQPVKDAFGNFLEMPLSTSWAPPSQVYTSYGPIYAVAVNAAEATYRRKLASSTDNADVNQYLSIGGSPVCVICQDGYNQPWRIAPDGTATLLQTYIQWVMGDPADLSKVQEYVPIGRYMLWKDPILYVAALDNTGRLTQILHSVSGRPCDFVVNIDTNGFKGGDAYTVAHRVSFDEITGLYDLNTTDGSFMVTTLKATYVVTPNLSKTVFGEPTFANYTLFPTGPLNPWSVADINGDTVLIDQSGLKSFNAMKQLKIESNSDPFSGQVYKLFRDIIQTVCCATNFDNYALFAVDTIYGPAIIVYDLILKCFVGVDIYTGLSRIVQFAEIKLEGERYLYFRTEDDELYRAFGSTTTAICRVYLGEWCCQDAQSEIKPEGLNIVLTNVEEGGDFQATLYVDRRKDIIRYNHVDFTPNSGSSTYPIPFPTNTDDNVRMLSYPYQEAKTGWKYGFLLEWACQASLSDVASTARTVTLAVDFHQQGSIHTNYVPQV